MNDPRTRSTRWKAALLAVLAAWIVLRIVVIRAFREKNPAVIGRVKAFNRRWFNPWMLRYAGHGRWYAARLEHRGRTTGALHATPVVAEPVREGFLIPLPYGRDVDWVHNLFHEGNGVLQYHDVRYHIGNPRIVPFSAVQAELPWLMRTVARLYGIDNFSRVDVLPSLTAEVSLPA
jgi:hypothetical protein